MESCAKCQHPIIDNEKVTARRRDGSVVTLCPDCAAEIQAGKRQRQAQTAKISPSNLDRVTPNSKEKSEDKWYKTIGSGILFLVFTILMAYQLNSLETGAAESVKVWLPVAILYRTLGYWGAIACPGLIAIAILGLGAKQFIDQENQT